MTKRKRALLERKETLLNQAREIAPEGADDLTDDQLQQHKDILVQVRSINEQIAAEDELDEQIRTMQLPDDARITGGQPRVEDDPKRGFAHLGEVCLAVRAACMGRAVDPRLVPLAAAPSTYGGEDVGTDGGYLVPPSFSQDVWLLNLEEGSFVPLTANTPVAGNTFAFPKDETTPWGTNGVRAYWEGEADAANATKPVGEWITMRLGKLMALVPVSDELLQDGVGVGPYVTRLAGRSIMWKTNDSIINGDGVAKPKGVINADALVTVTKETSQTAATINATNVLKMYSRQLRPAQSFWLVSPDAYNQLPLMTIGDQPVFIAANQGMQNAPSGLLLGRPVIITDTCQTLGTAGDIFFIDFGGGYQTITKAGGIESATSMHLYFDAAATAFRFIFRIDGQPILQNAVSPANGSSTRSCYVRLATRS